ncbi:MAG: tetratricopeptide repeat protein [Bacteroidales bacterium]|jgi:tetratricopeptide (TPR) repeat protein|nr:tetratricopeptide repeat protein [Bacteroidales bacterium]
MNERIEDFFNEDDFFASVRKYEDMMKERKSCFFDVNEFEDILGYYIEEENTVKAKEVLRLANKIHPHSMSIRIKEAQVLLKNNEAEEANELLALLQSVEQSNPDVFLLKGSALAQLGEYANASVAFDKALALCEEDISAYASNVAEIFESHGKYKDALKYFLLALHSDPEEYSYHNDIAFCCDRIGKYNRALEHYQAFLDEEPFSDNAWFNIGFIYNKINEQEKALESYNYCLAITPEHPSAYFNKGNTLMSLTRYEDAVQVFKEFIELEPTNAAAYCYAGECLERMGQHDEALVHFKKSLRYDEKFPEAWYGVAKIMFNKDLFDETLHYLENAIGLDQENADYWMLMGELYIRQDEPGKAITAFESAVMCDINKVLAYKKIGALKMDSGKFIEAYTFLKMNYDRISSDADVNYLIAACSYKMEDLLTTVTYFEKGLSQNYSGHHMFLKYAGDAVEDQKVKDVLSIYQNRN